MTQNTQLSRRTLLMTGAASALLGLAGCGGGSTIEAGGAARTNFTLGWSIYTGFMPWYFAEKAGLVDKWAKKYGLTIKLVQVNDYVESINQYTAGKLDAVLATSMDLLTIPAASGRDTSVVIIGDYSNGNDGIVLKKGQSVADLRGQTINIVELSVSHYLLARALEQSGLQLTDVKTFNTGDADMVSMFATPAVTAVATWNPQLWHIRKIAGAKEVFNSAKIPNEILDCLGVSTQVLLENPDFGKALVSIWYETMSILRSGGADAENAIAHMAKGAGTTPESLTEQIRDTYFYADPNEVGLYAESPNLIEVTDRVRKFSFSRGLFGSGATSVDSIGIAFPGGKVLGDPNRILLRFDATYMKFAAIGL